MPNRYAVKWVKGEGRFSREYVIQAEKALGKRLPEKAVVHHHSDTELVICPSQNYHMLLHRRMDALLACGNPEYRKCIYCGQWDHPDQLKYYSSNRNWRHVDCSRLRDRQRYQKGKTNA